MRFFVFTAVLLGLALANQELVDKINSANLGWTAEFNEEHPVYGLNPTEFRAMLTTPRLQKSRLPVKVMAMNNDLPENFDARTEWPDAITPIRNQGGCGSCWTFGAAETFGDRHNIKTGEFNVYSTQYLVSCAHSAGDGCNGSRDLHGVHNYLRDHGIPKDSCLPYVSGNDGRDHECRDTCVDGSRMTFTRNKDAYTLDSEAAMMQDLVQNGPFEVAFMVYSDFQYYRSGVYEHKFGQLEGGHAIALRGYGVEDGKKYWLCANSWDTNWGEDGYFKILRGENHCEIESFSTAGTPA